MKKYLYIISVIFLVTRLAGLGADISNSDAARWHRRSENFVRALKNAEFRETYQRYHPGVTLMWINGGTKVILSQFSLTLENADHYPIIHGVSKGVLVFILFILLLVQIKYLEKLFNKKTAYLYAFLVSVEPYLIGINRWFHLTSLEVFLGFTALLALLVWYKDERKKDLYICSVLFGLSILTKVSGAILAPAFLIIFLKKKDFKSLCVFGILSIFVFFVLFPAMWVSPGAVLAKMYISLVGSVEGTVRISTLPKYLEPVFYFLIALFKLSPITLLLFIVSMLKREEKNEYIKIMYISLITFFIALTVGGQKIDRYLVSFMPYMLVVISNWLSTKNTGDIKKVIGASSLFLVASTLSHFPIYSAYYNPLVGGANAALKMGVYDNSGEYFAQAAQYLNTKGRDKNTFVPNNIESFSYYYKANVQRELGEDTNYIIESLDSNRKEYIYCSKKNIIFQKPGLVVCEN